MTKEDFKERVHEIRCIICWFKLGHITYPVQGHHVIGGDDWSMTPLCEEHHQGVTGVHGMHRAAFYRLWKVDDRWMLARTAELMAKE